MKSQKERIKDMENYFKSYIEHINNHYTIDTVIKNGGPRDVKQDSLFNSYDMRSYYQKIILQLSTQVPDTLTTSELQKELRIDVGSIMNPENYKAGSTLINLKRKSDTEYEAKIYYTPKIPVYDFQINNSEHRSSYFETLKKKN